MTSRRRRVELIEAAIIVVVAGFFYAMTFEISEPIPGVEVIVTPGSFPQLILGLIIVLGLANGILALRAPADATVTLPWDRMVVMTAVLSLAYAVAARYLGVFIPMPFYCVALAWLWGGRSLVTLAAMAVGLPAAIWVLFDLIFRSQLPLGPLFEQ